jgi:anti-anti-sigma factor
MMEIETLEKNGYHLIRIKDDLLHETDMTPLKNEVQSQMDKGTVNLAISFTGTSIFFSRAIAVLVQTLGQVKEFGGQLAVVHPNPGMLEVFTVVGLEKLIQTHTSEETIGV